MFELIELSEERVHHLKASGKNGHISRVNAAILFDRSATYTQRVGGLCPSHSPRSGSSQTLDLIYAHVTPSHQFGRIVKPFCIPISNTTKVPSSSIISVTWDSGTVV